MDMVTAHAIVDQIRMKGFTKEAQPDRAALAVVEESGEFIGAYRRWTGQARRTGPESAVIEELADVVISAYAMAAEHGWDLNEAVTNKLHIAFARGWRE